MTRRFNDINVIIDRHFVFKRLVDFVLYPSRPVDVYGEVLVTSIKDSVKFLRKREMKFFYCNIVVRFTSLYTGRNFVIRLYTNLNS